MAVVHGASMTPPLYICSALELTRTESGPCVASASTITVSLPLYSTLWTLAMEADLSRIAGEATAPGVLAMEADLLLVAGETELADLRQELLLVASDLARSARKIQGSYLAPLEALLRSCQQRNQDNGARIAARRAQVRDRMQQLDGSGTYGANGALQGRRPASLSHRA